MLVKKYEPQTHRKWRQKSIFPYAYCILTTVFIYCFSGFSLSAEAGSKIGDDGKCGRDCAYYVLLKLGIGAYP